MADSPLSCRFCNLSRHENTIASPWAGESRSLNDGDVPFRGTSPAYNAVFDGNLRNFGTSPSCRLTGEPRRAVNPLSGQQIKHAEKDIHYDKNGNFLSMVRILNGAVDTLSFAYNGNQDVRNDYDAAGYLSRETPSGIEYSYNFLKRPEQISHLDYGPLAIISYLADGTKFHVREVFGNSWSGRQRQELFYIGSLIFTKNQDDEFYHYTIMVPDGRIIYDEIGGGFHHQYSADRIGSVRADIVDGGDDWDENDYLAYGTRMPGIGYNNPENRWRFNGKEEFRLYPTLPAIMTETNLGIVFR